MPPGDDPPEPYFVAYFDEAGDPGIKTVAPIDPNGANEWFSVGYVVVRATNESNWLASSNLSRLRFIQRRVQIFVEHKKKPVCDALAASNCRMFVVVSNKKNMRKYRNPKAEAVSLHPNNWFTITASELCWSA